MIYLDTSVALAQLLSEDQRPPQGFWEQEFIASRLLEYEIWTRLNARRLAVSHGDHATRLLARIALVEMVPDVLSRTLEPFPVGVRTLDALHLSTLHFLAERRLEVRLATYDERMRAAAVALGFQVADLS